MLELSASIVLSNWKQKTGSKKKNRDLHGEGLGDGCKEQVAAIRTDAGK